MTGGLGAGKPGLVDSWLPCQLDALAVDAPERATHTPSIFRGRNSFNV